MRTRDCIRAVVCLGLVCAAASPLWAGPVLPALFSDHMVLQRDRELPIWGWAAAGEKMSVTIGSVTRSTVAGPDGRWKVLLPPLKAGGPFVLTVRGQKTVRIKDVLIGEVWVFSGQSNMAFALSGAEGASKEILTADRPHIRLFTVPKQSATRPQHTLMSSWQICSPETAGGFSAVAYFFGKELHNALGVPIGLIHSSWPGTAAESWTDEASLRSDAQLAPILQEWAEAAAEAKRLARGSAEVDLQFDDFELIPSAGPASSHIFSDFDDGTRNALHGYWTYDWQSAPNSIFELSNPGRGGAGFAARITGRLAAGDSSLLRASFSADAAAVDLSSYAGFRFYYRGHGDFRLHSMQPTIVDWDNYATPAFTAQPDWQSATVWFKDLKQAGWGKLLPFTPESLSGFMIEALRSADGQINPPSHLYNGMIAPLVPYAIRGVAWYQGESNAPRAYQYRRLLPALITGWRRAWGQGNFPFLIVQLPNYGRPKAVPQEDAWAELREAQFQTLQLSNTGLAVTIDVGEADDIHPHNKAEVGRRLALWALGTTYQQKIVYSGPLYDSMQVEPGRIRLHFRQVGSGLKATDGTPLKGFAIAGTDGVFHWADAAIEGDSVVVWSRAVAAPAAVRYAWAGNPECNLQNHEGLPASPFRTDNGPGITGGKAELPRPRLPLKLPAGAKTGERR